MSRIMTTSWMACSGSTVWIARRTSGTSVSGGNAERTMKCMGLMPISALDKCTSGTTGLPSPSFRTSPTTPTT